MSWALIWPGFSNDNANLVQSSKTSFLEFIPPLVIGLIPILLSPTGDNSLISDNIFPFSSNNSDGLYDNNHFSSSSMCSGFSALTGKGTWWALKLPSIASLFQVLGHVQPLGVLTIIIGHLGIVASIALCFLASFWIDNIFSITLSNSLIISACIFSGLSPSTK